MSFSLSLKGQKDELVGALEAAFANNYPEPAEGVADLVGVGIDAVSAFASTSGDEGNFNVSLSGHARQSDTDRDSLNVSIQSTE